MRNTWGHSGKCEDGCTCVVAGTDLYYPEYYSRKPLEKRENFKCSCGKYEGTEHGLKTHIAMVHKKFENKEIE